MAIFNITVYSHHFKVEILRDYYKKYIYSYTKKLTQFDFVKGDDNVKRWSPTAFYYGETSIGNEWRFHISLYEDFINYFSFLSISIDDFSITKVKEVEALDVELKVKEKWIPRDYQLEMIDNLTIKNNIHTKILSLKTGRGKTFTTLLACAKLGKRIFILIKPNYIEQWIKSALDIYEIDQEDILIIKGSDSLKNLILNARLGLLTEKIIICSLKTYRIFLDSYEENVIGFYDEGYDCYPDELFSLLKVGPVIIDECHLEFYSVVKFISYLHCYWFICLSATIMSDDPFIEKIQRMVFPINWRYQEKDVEAYKIIHPVPYHFSFNNLKKIRTRERGGAFYSHHAFEKSVIKNSFIKDSYLNLIDWILNTHYIKEYNNKNTCLIFASSINLCRLIASYLEIKYPNFKVKTYVESDPYENLMSGDIVVATVGKAGTAVDKPNLTAVIMTVNINSSSLNIQNFGRLREIKNSDVRFYYLYCTQIDKHREYNKKRLELIRRNNEAKLISEIPYPAQV